VDSITNTSQSNGDLGAFNIGLWGAPKSHENTMVLALVLFLPVLLQRPTSEVKYLA